MHSYLYLYSEDDDKSIHKLNDLRTTILNNDANDYDTAQVIKKKIVQDYLLRGKAFLLNKNDKLYHLPAKNVREELYTEDSITVAKKEFIYEGLSTITLDEHEVIVIDSGSNGLLVDAGELFQTAINQQSYNKSVMENGALPTGILQATSRLTENAITRLRESWQSLYGGSKAAGKTVILEEGLEFNPLSLKPDELQMVDSQKQIISEIARVFNIPESMINRSANKYNSLQMNNIQYMQHCLGPIITSIESAISKNLLTHDEKIMGFYFRFDTSEILRTTEKEKVETVSKGLKDGLYSFNEARHKLDMKPVDKDYFVMSLGSVLKDSETGELTIPNMGVVEEQSGGENPNE
ncbi:phage portal protein [Radiobacillus deserti]|uniref:Phage portal protein n=1 Tax=Radiobacillus deserti TaxID=2594883 RepID=A0A516KDG0_9BACI|nr:phage portal protein [Radiobacillus deserti]QDP39438.1 phage portal protein [Radiobacillus deserti]